MLAMQDITEALAQLAMYSRGLEVLLQDSSVAEALQRVATHGWEEQARQYAQSALAALADRQPDTSHVERVHCLKHIMISCRCRKQTDHIHACSCNSNAVYT